MNAHSMSERGYEPLDLKPNPITGSGCLMGWRIADSKDRTIGATNDSRLAAAINMIGRIDFWHIMYEAWGRIKESDPTITFDEFSAAFKWLEDEAPTSPEAGKPLPLLADLHAMDIMTGERKAMEVVPLTAAEVEAHRRWIVSMDAETATVDVGWLQRMLAHRDLLAAECEASRRRFPGDGIGPELHASRQATDRAGVLNGGAE